MSLPLNAFDDPSRRSGFAVITTLAYAFGLFAGMILWLGIATPAAAQSDVDATEAAAFAEDVEAFADEGAHDDHLDDHLSAEIAAAPGDSLLPKLLEAAQRGEGDPHLPFVLHRLEQAMNAQNLIGFLDLVEPSYFEKRFKALLTPGRSPGQAMNEFSCAFFELCDISKAYAYTDVVSARVVAVAPEAQDIRVRMEMRMWDGIFLNADIIYDPATVRLRSGRV